MSGRWTTLAALVACLAACGDDSPDVGPDAGPVDADVADLGFDAEPDAGYDAGLDAGVDLGPLPGADGWIAWSDAVCDGYAQASCDALRDCGCTIADRSACVAAARAECEAGVAVSRDSLESGAYVPFADRARACVARVREAAGRCESVSPARAIELCAGTFGADVTLGEACADGAYCAGGDGICNQGACAPLPSFAVCYSDVVCGRGQVCVFGDCRALGLENETCERGDQCVPGLICRDGACNPPSPVGGPCTVTDDCVAGAVCGASGCELAVGCTEDTDCRGDSRCVGELQCVPPRVLGDTCNPESPVACDRVSWCNPETRRCQRLPGPLERCINFTSCDPDVAFCNGPEALCAPLIAEGAPCDSAFTCQAGLGCNGVACVRRSALPGDGEFCALGMGGSSECAEGLICLLDLETSIGRCRAPSGVGGACDFSGVSCQEGLACVDSICQAPAPLGGDCLLLPCAAGTYCEIDYDAFTFVCVTEVPEAPCANDRPLGPCGDGLYCGVEVGAGHCEPIDGCP